MLTKDEAHIAYTEGLLVVVEKDYDDDEHAGKIGIIDEIPRNGPFVRMEFDGAQRVRNNHWYVPLSMISFYNPIPTPKSFLDI